MQKNSIILNWVIVIRASFPAPIERIQIRLWLIGWVLDGKVMRNTRYLLTVQSLGVLWEITPTLLILTIIFAKFSPSPNASFSWGQIWLYFQEIVPPSQLPNQCPTIRSPTPSTHAATHTDK